MKTIAASELEVGQTVMGTETNPNIRGTITNVRRFTMSDRVSVEPLNVNDIAIQIGSRLITLDAAARVHVWVDYTEAWDMLNGRRF